MAEWIACAKSHTNRQLERRRLDREGYPAVPANLRQQGRACNQMVDPRRRTAPKADAASP